MNGPPILGLPVRNNNNSRGSNRQTSYGNTPDIVIKNKKDRTCILIDVAIPADRNVTQKEAQKKLKYNSLCTEIQRMWNMKCMIVPVIIGATGVVTKGLKKCL